jgi:hypothetical protein
MSKKISMIHQPQKNQIEQKHNSNNVMIFLVDHVIQFYVILEKKPILSHFLEKAVFIALFPLLYHTKAIKWS